MFPISRILVLQPEHSEGMDFPGAPPGDDEPRDGPSRKGTGNEGGLANNTLDVFGDRTDVPFIVFLFVAALMSQTFTSMFCRC